MIKKFSKIFLFSLFLFLYNCKAPSTVVYEEGNIRKGMSRKDMSKAFRFKMLGAHNPFKGECFHEYYPQKKRKLLQVAPTYLQKFIATLNQFFIF